MTESNDETLSSRWSEIKTDREQKPTCSWCGTNSSDHWKYVIATGKFYCSDGCLKAAYYRLFRFIWVASIICIPLSIFAYFSLESGAFKELALYLFYVFLVGVIGGLAYFIESKMAQSRISKNSESVQDT